MTDDSAAIQRAFDNINGLDQSPVLWFPSGTYLLRTTAKLHHKQTSAVIGEDSKTTVLKWNGAPGGTMLQTDASTYFRITRLTFDGSGLANTAEDINDLNSGPGGFLHHLQ